MNISDTVCYLERLTLDELESLRYEHEDDEAMLLLIDAEIEAKTVPRCMFCEAELSGKSSYCHHCKMSPGTYHYD